MSAARKRSSGFGRGVPPAPRAPQTLNERLDANTRAAGAKLFTYSLINTALSLTAAIAAIGVGVKPTTAAFLALVPLVTTVASYLMRRAALTKLRRAGETGLSEPLFSAQKQSGRSVWISRLGSLAPMDLGGMLALKFMQSEPLAGAALWAAVFGGWAVWRQAKKFGKAVNLQRAGLYGGLKEGRPQIAGEDIRELERVFRDLGAGRDYATAKDFVRLWKADAARANPLSRLIGRIAFQRRLGRLLASHADRVVEEDGKLVPTISRAGLVRESGGN